MQKITIDTSQNVSIEYQLASVGDRIGAVIIDLFVQFIYIFVAIFLVYLLEKVVHTDTLFTVLFFVIYVPLLFYDFLMEWLFNGQTIGKRAQKIQVIKIDGSKPTALSYFIRWLLRLVDCTFSLYVVGLLSMLITKRTQRLGDLAANTIVVKLNTEVKLEDTIFMAVESDYEVQFPQVSLLNDRDISVVKEVIVRCQLIEDPIAYDQLMTKALSVVTAKMNIQVSMDRLEFLKTIVADYSHMNMQ
jgi:uncharacterized RDD family membrane protein YckC